ncbi:MAG: archaemetzincin [Myxococcaceae bacterium]
MLNAALVGLTVLAAAPMNLAARQKDLRAEKLGEPFERLRPLATPLRAPGDSDWLAGHEERGQWVAGYMISGPVRPTERQRTIYLQLIGTFTPAQARVVKLTADYLERYFGLPVKQAEPLSASLIPGRARRVHPSWGVPQILSTYVMDEVLAPRRAPDAVATIGFTGEDLWPGEGWNFVFGQASLRERVGVWSIHRFGDPGESPEAFRQCLRRTLSTAVHELSHMLSIEHCIAYECVMAGSNHLEESDRRPIEPCPACLQKLCWNTGCDPVKRFERLAEFQRANGLAADAAYLKRALAALRAPAKR